MDPAQQRSIEQTCRNLVIALVHHYDHGEAEAAAGLFVPDGVWVKSRVPYRGHAAIVASFAAQPAGLVLRHVTSNVLITVHDDAHATGVTYYLAYVGHRPEGAPADAELPFDGPASLGEWRDEFVATAEGWRFQRRDGRRVFGRRHQG